MMTPDQISLALQDRRLQWVAEATGLHYNTLRALRDGEAKDIKLRTAVVLTEYFQRGAGSATPHNTTEGAA